MKREKNYNRRLNDNMLTNGRKEWMEIFYTKPAGQAAALAEAQTFAGSA